jgi:glycerophosphoryl diester phosphodiesterase
MALRPLLYAHRLGRDAGPDSSAAALAVTLDGPADGVETDVCLTADRELVLLHDPWLATGTTATGWAHEVPWNPVLRDARLRDRTGEPTDERVLRLDDVLDLVPTSFLLQFDVKVHGDPALAADTAQAVGGRLRERRAEDRAEILSFHSAACASSAALGQRTRLIVWADHDPQALVRWTRANGVAGVCVEHFLLHTPLVATLLDGGLSVATGTINDPELAHRVTALGVDAITTDAPERLAAPPDAQLALSAAMMRG